MVGKISGVWCIDIKDILKIKVFMIRDKCNKCRRKRYNLFFYRFIVLR